MQFSNSLGIVCGCKLKHVYSPYMFNQHDLWYAGLNLTAAASLPLYHLPHIRQRKYYTKTWISTAGLCEINSENICKTLHSDRKAHPLEKRCRLVAWVLFNSWNTAALQMNKRRETWHCQKVWNCELHTITWGSQYNAFQTASFYMELLTDPLVAHFVISHFVHSFYFICFEETLLRGCYFSSKAVFTTFQSLYIC